jgi:hypothetical protein
MQACLARGTQFYTVSQIVDATDQNRSEVRHRLWKLEAAGLITRVSDREIPPEGRGRPTKEIQYRNTGLLKKKASSPAARKINGWDRMWQTIRALRRFTRTDLVTICGQSLGNVCCFTKFYRRLGYIRPAKELGKNVVWTLINDPGPKRPLGSVNSAAKGGNHVD